VLGLERARKWQAPDAALCQALLEIDRLLYELSKEKLESQFYSEELTLHIKELRAERFELFSALESLTQ
jgi:hypothetical protein